MRPAPITLAIALAACGTGGRVETPRPPITVFAAASLARPLRALADSFQHSEHVQLLTELGGSLEQSRKITDLGRTPDVLMLVDDEVIAALLPAHLDWYVRFATNRMVVAYAPRSRYADSITAENWWRSLARPDVQVGRADPTIAPVGRHALSLLRKAESYYQRPGLADSVIARSPLRNVRPSATELAALLETGEVDYILEYESVARQYGFRYVVLPDDLSPADSLRHVRAAASDKRSRRAGVRRVRAVRRWQADPFTGARQRPGCAGRDRDQRTRGDRGACQNRRIRALT